MCLTSADLEDANEKRLNRELQGFNELHGDYKEAVIESLKDKKPYHPSQDAASALEDLTLEE